MPTAIEKNERGFVGSPTELTRNEVGGVPAGPVVLRSVRFTVAPSCFAHQPREHRQHMHCSRAAVEKNAIRILDQQAAGETVARRHPPIPKKPEKKEEVGCGGGI
jgi:hypothetical protein